MHDRIKELADQAGVRSIYYNEADNIQKLAELIVKECINTLEFHGFDEAIPYIQWMATNKLGVK